MRVVIVGGVACGAKTAARLARVCPNAEITMLERGPDLSYANCGFPFYVGGEVANSTGLTHMGFGAARDADYFKEYASTRALTGHEVVRIDREKKQVVARVGATGEEKNFLYDKLVLATGASPIRPQIPGMELSNVFTLWTLRDAVAMRDVLDNETVRKVVIVGAGLVGAETAEMLKRRGLEVTLVDALPYPLMALAGEDGGAMLSTHLAKNGIAFCGSETVTALTGDGRVEKVMTDKRELDADLVLISIGVRPNLDLARGAGLALGEKALRVDEFMRTSDPDIYAGGDCVESRCVVTGEYLWQPMGSVANRQGRVIADHIAGLKNSFGGVGRTAIARLFDWTVARTGLTFEEAKESGLSPVGMWVTAPDLPGFMSGSAPLFIRLVADLKTRRVLGGRLLGPGKIDKRLDLLATAVKGCLTIDELADVDSGYAPPFATAMDAITHAANALRNKIDGLLCSCSASELKAKAENKEAFLVLDVRTAKEPENFGRLPYDTIHIPLGELKKRKGELTRERELVILCKAGARAWSAYAMLRSNGYAKLCVLEGGMSAWPYEKAPR